jgi:uncharacterized repeat protein (TIGR01451 family)
MTSLNKSGSRKLLIIRITMVVVALAVTVLVVPNVWAVIEVPNSNNDIFFQTSADQTPLNIGDYYTNATGDNTHHLARINIPCIPNETYRVELFDPEVYDAGPPPGAEIVDDEVRPQPPGPADGDPTSFTLRSPNGSVIATNVYPSVDPTGPPPPSHDAWVTFGTITLPASPVISDTCGIYTIEPVTGDESGNANITNDDNAWKYQVLGGPGGLGTETFDAAFGPDNLPGTGDEVTLAVQRLSYQHNLVATQTFSWFVNAGNPNWTGRNFDVDIDDGVLPDTGLCGGITNPNCSITYVSPSGATFPATLSGNAEWNPGQPNRGTGDVFTNVEPGLWHVEVQIPVNNQYIIEIEGSPVCIVCPPLPDVFINKDDFVVEVKSPGVTTYTIAITNTGPGAAMPIAGPEVVDTLPPNTTFASCAILPPLEGTCAESAPGIVSYELNGQTQPLDAASGNVVGPPILAYLPGINSTLVNSGRLQLVVNINPGLADSTLLTNTAQVDWTDIDGNDYAPRSDDDTDIVRLNGMIHVQKLTNGFDANDPNADPVPEINPGDTVTWEYIVTNIGDAPLSNVTVTDDQGVIPVFVGGDTNNNGLLDLTETWIFQATGVAQDLASSNQPATQCGPGGFTRPTYANRGIASGQISQTTPVTDDDLSHYCNPPPGIIHVEKLTNGVDADDPNADPVPEISPGDTVTWEYIVTNIGTVPLSNVNVEDDQLA